MLNYTKGLCDSLSGASADTCKFDVDIYGPAVFVLLNQYLQPDPVCAAVHMCANATTAATATTTQPQQQPREWGRGSMKLLPGATRGGGAGGGSLLLRGGAAGAAQQQQQRQRQREDMARFFDVWVGRGKQAQQQQQAGGRAPLDADHRGEQQPHPQRSWVVQPGPGETWTEQRAGQQQQQLPAAFRGAVPADEDDYPPYAYYGDYDPPLYESGPEDDPLDRYVSDQNDGLRVAGQLPSRDVERAVAASSRQVVEEAWRRVDDGLLFYDDEEDDKLFRNIDRVDAYEDTYDTSLRLEKGDDDYGVYTYSGADTYDGEQHPLAHASLLLAPRTPTTRQLCVRAPPADGPVFPRAAPVQCTTT